MRNVLWNLGIIVLVALAYYATGRLGLSLALPPGYATAIWPPSGIALAAVLLAGNRVWPGVFLGSFLINVGTGFDAASPAVLAASLVLPAVIGMGAAGQAVLGGTLVRRFGAYPNQLCEAGWIGRLLFLGGPLACLVNASVGVAAIVMAGRMPLAVAPVSWATWWAGDAMGVVVFTPTLLSWLTPGFQDRKRRALAATGWLFTAFALTVLAVWHANRLQDTAVALKFEETAQNMAVQLTKDMDVRFSAVFAVKGLFASGPRDFQDFTRFSEELRHHTPGLQALEWVPRVANAARPGFEGEMAANDLSDFHITESRDGEIVPAAERDEYFPVAYVEPARGNVSAVGFDLGSDPSRRSAMELARDGNQVVLSPPLHLVQGGDGFLAFAPVYAGGLPLESVEQRRAALQGFALGVIRSDEFFAQVFQGMDLSGLHTRITDGPEILMSSGENAPTPLALSGSGLFGNGIILGHATPVVVGLRSWQLTVAPGLDFVVRNKPAEGWVLLLGGLLLTSMMCGFVLIITGREGALRERVGEATASLRDSEEKYRGLTETIGDWVWEIDTEGRFLYVSPKVETQLGYPPDEVLGHLVSEFLDETERDLHRQGLQDHVRDGRNFLVAVPHRHRDGHVVILEAHGEAVFDALGKVRGFRGINRDVTERQRAAERLHRQYESLRLLNNIAALPAGDLGGRLAEALRLGLGHLGLDTGIVSRIKGERTTVIAQQSPPESGLATGAEFATATTPCALTLQAGDVVAMEDLGNSPHAGHLQSATPQCYVGAPVVVRGEMRGTVSFTSARPYGRAFDEGDVEFMRLLARWVGSAMELDENIAALNAARSRIEAILDNTPVGITILNQDRVIVRVNKAFSQIYNATEDSMAGRPSRILYRSDEDYATFGGRAYAAMAHGRTFLDEVAMRRGDNAEIWVRVSARQIDPQQADLGYIFAVEDITAQRAAKQELADKNIELARSNQELEAFAYVASHDLRQPLRHVASYMTLLEKCYADRLDDEGREFIGFARSGAERMDRLIVALLEYSRIGRKSSGMAKVSLAGLLDDVLLTLGPVIEDSQAEVTLALPEDLPPLWGDSVELSRLFQNLLGNALKYRRPAQAPRITISATQPAQAAELVVSVADNGIGISPQHFDRIFGIFQRLHAADKYEGTGIGLAVCKKVVEHHGGRIWLESAEDAGTTFYVALPVG